MSVFNNPDIAKARSYTLKCMARSQSVNDLLDLVDGESEGVRITEGNIDELRSLCEELGFQGLDNEFREFRRECGSEAGGLKEVVQLKEQVKCLGRQLSEASSSKRESEPETLESILRQVRSLERKVDDLSRICEERNMEASRKTGSVCVAPPPTTMEQRRELVYDGWNKLNGIIAYLTCEFGGSIWWDGTVNVMGSGTGLKEAVELEKTSCYESDFKDSWICYDFNDRRVIPTSYSVRSDPDGRGLKSWVIDVSNDEYSWTEIDRRENNNDLNGDFALCNFEISSVPSESFRFFRLRQIGESHHGDYKMAISALEIFGTLLVTEKIEQPRPPKQEFVYHADREGHSPPPLFHPKLDGIIASLTREFGKEVHDQGIVNVLGTGPYERDGVVFNKTKYYYSGFKDWWVCYDFNDRHVIPTSYSVRLDQSGRGLKSWVIDVSNDGYSWTEIDRRENNNDLNGKFALSNFEISSVPSESFRFFRLRQTGETDHGDEKVVITALEIFGTLLVSEKIEQPRSPKEEFVYHADWEGQSPPPLCHPKLDGIIAHLTREFGGNVYDKGIINVMGTGRGQREAVELEASGYYQSDFKDWWICYDFNGRRVIPTSYSVRSSEYCYYLKSWVVEVSNDGDSWTEIDRRENNNDLSSRFALCNFEISTVPSESFRFFRLRQTGESDCGDYKGYISALEIFGTLHVTEKIEQPRPPKQQFVCHADREGHSPPPLFHPKLDGIIAHLTREFGGNVHDKGIVYVMGIGLNQREAVELESSVYYHSQFKNSSICYDFNDRRVIPTSYSLGWRDGGFGDRHTKSWVIEVSNDGYSWTEIDRRNSNKDLMGKFAICNFEISSVPSESFRFFRLSRLGCDDWLARATTITALEIFGTLLVTEKIEQPRVPKQEFVYRADREGLSPSPVFHPKLDGIIAYLTRRFGGNVHDRGIVNVTANRAGKPFDLPKNAVDLGTIAHYWSDIRPNSWICYDFKERRVIPTSYSVMSGDWGRDFCHLKSWVIEVSNDGDSWMEIDCRRRNNDLNSEFALCNFKISRVPSEGFRFFRLRQAGKSHDHMNDFSLSSLEIFGTLFEK